MSVPDDEVALILRTTDIPADGPVDVVVHLHGVLGSAAAMSLLEKEPLSGLDFCSRTIRRPGCGAHSAHDRIRRVASTRGSALPRTDSGYKRAFPGVRPAAGLQELIDFSPSSGSRRRSDRESLERNRSTSDGALGGGSALDAILGHSAPHEVQVFDATYVASDPFRKWLTARLRMDIQRLRDRADDDVYGDMQERGGAMRVLYIRGTRTEAAAVEYHKLLAAALNAAPDMAHLLCPWYRVETAGTPVLAHDPMASMFGWQMLYSAASDSTPAVERPPDPAINCDPPAAPVEDTSSGAQGMSFYSSALDRPSIDDCRRVRCGDPRRTKTCWPPASSRA